MVNNKKKQTDIHVKKNRDKENRIILIIPWNGQERIRNQFVYFNTIDLKVS